MNVLIACEFSGRVREAFLRKGHNAFSCDILPDLNNSPSHIQRDVKEVLGWGWDLVIAHPPCTYLCSSGLHWNKRRPERGVLTQEAAEFFMQFIHSAPKVCIENPIGIMSRLYRKPDQIIQPWWFGEDANKATCLWLNGLPTLHRTQEVVPRIIEGKPRWANQTDSGQNRLGPSKDRASIRSLTYQGIADAMAEQWG